jgi:hypothetical protein
MNCIWATNWLKSFVVRVDWRLVKVPSWSKSVLLHSAVSFRFWPQM